MGDKLSTKDIMARVNAALKQITVSDLDDSVLNADQADTFIQVVEKSTPMLEETRRLDMTTPERNIDRTGFGQRIMKNPEEESITEASHGTKPEFDTNVLDVVKIKGIVSIKDDTMEDNIERDNFENTLLQMIGERVGVDMEYLFIAGDETFDSGNDPLDDWEYLSRLNGWYARATHELDGGTDNFDASDVEDMFDALFKAIDRKFISNRAQWRYWVHYDIEDDYRNVLRARGTALGDTAQTAADGLVYKGIPVVPIGNMPEGRCILGHPDNHAYGIRRDVRIEPEREAKEEQTDFIITARVDADYENEDAAAVAKNYTG